MSENLSLHVHVETYIFEVSRIDDKALTMTFELYMDFMWEETRWNSEDLEGFKSSNF